MNQIHLFGWGQGGTMSLELALDVGKSRNGENPLRLGSVTSICAGLESHPSSPLELATPILYFTRARSRAAVGQKMERGIRRAFRDVEVVRGEEGRGEDMPRGRSEWEGIMRFWGKVLGKDDEGWKGGGEVFEVVK